MAAIQRNRSPLPPATNPSEKSTSSASPTTTPTSATSSSTTPAVPPRTIYKLLFFTLAMFTAPLMAYYSTVNAVFKGNSTYAGALAALVANLVLFGYVIAAVREDQGEGGQGRKGGKIE